MRFNQVTKRDAQPRHLIHNFLRLGYCVTLTGKRECGKTDLATAIAIAVAEGSPFAGMPTTQGGVLWLAAEDPYEREKSLRPLMPRLEGLPLYVTYARPAIDTAEGLQDIAHWIRKTKARLIVIDPIDAAHSGGLGWDARATLAPFKSLCYRMGVTGLILHTITTAVNPFIEAAHFAAATDMSILYASENTKDGRLIALHGTGRGEDSNRSWQLLSRAPFDYERAPAAYPYVDAKPYGVRNGSPCLQGSPNGTRTGSPCLQGEPQGGGAVTRNPTRFSLDDEVLATIAISPQALSAVNISDRINRNPNSIRNAIARLIATGKIRCTHHANRARHFQAHVRFPLPLGEDPSLKRSESGRR